MLQSEDGKSAESFRDSIKPAKPEMKVVSFSLTQRNFIAISINIFRVSPTSF